MIVVLIIFIFIFWVISKIENFCLRILLNILVAYFLFLPTIMMVGVEGGKGDGNYSLSYYTEFPCAIFSMICGR